MVSVIIMSVCLYYVTIMVYLDQGCVWCRLLLCPYVYYYVTQIRAVYGVGYYYVRMFTIMLLRSGLCMVSVIIMSVCLLLCNLDQGCVWCRLLLCPYVYYYVTQIRAVYGVGYYYVRMFTIMLLRSGLCMVSVIIMSVCLLLCYLDQGCVWCRLLLCPYIYYYVTQIRAVYGVGYYYVRMFTIMSVYLDQGCVWCIKLLYRSHAITLYHYQLEQTRDTQTYIYMTFYME